MSLLEPDVWNVGAVPGVPAQGRSPELARLVDQQPDELESVGEAHVVELCGPLRGPLLPGSDEPLLLVPSGDQSGA